MGFLKFKNLTTSALALFLGVSASELHAENTAALEPASSSILGDEPFSFFGTSATLFSTGQAQRTLGFDFSSYPFLQTVGPNHNPDTSDPSVYLHWHEMHQGSWLQAVGVTSMQLTYEGPGHSSFFFEIPEVYVGLSGQNRATQLEVGRKIQHWNELDETWQLGIWQPRFRWDYIRPESVGLMGTLLSFHSSHFEFRVLGSPVFIPERGVQVAVENGEVTSRSPWFLPPPSEVSIRTRMTAVEYSIELPEVADLVKNPGVNLLMKLGESTGPWITAAYAYKPMNQLLLAYDGYLRLNGNGESSGVVKATVFPRVIYHHLSSLELGYEQPQFRFSLSALSERPIRDRTPPGWTTQEVAPALSVSPTIELLLGGDLQSPTQLQLSYLRVWGGNAPDGGIFGSATGSVFESRYPFSEAAQLGLKSSLARVAPFLRGVSLYTRVLQDIPNEGTILSTELRYRTRQNFEIALGADVLGTAKESVNVAEDGSSPATNFISRYRTNDRFHAGISYVF